MKRFAILIILILGFVTACGGSSGAEEVFTPADDWIPLVQGAPRGSGLRLEPPEPPVNFYMQPLEEQLVHIFGPEIGRAYWNSLIVLEYIHHYLSINEAGGELFPAYYGGMFVNRDTGMLYVMLVEERPDEAADFLEFLEGFDGVNMMFVEFSLAELMETADKVNLALGYFGVWTSNYVFVDEMLNRVVVIIANYNEDEKQRFIEEVFYSPMIEFRESFNAEFGWGTRPAAHNPAPPLRTIPHLEGITVEIDNLSIFNAYFVFENASDIDVLVELIPTIEFYFADNWWILPSRERPLNIPTALIPADTGRIVGVDFDSDAFLRRNRRIQGTYRARFAVIDDGGLHEIVAEFEWPQE